MKTKRRLYKKSRGKGKKKLRGENKRAQRAVRSLMRSFKGSFCRRKERRSLPSSASKRRMPSLARGRRKRKLPRRKFSRSEKA